MRSSFAFSPPHLSRLPAQLARRLPDTNRQTAEQAARDHRLPELLLVVLHPTAPRGVHAGGAAEIAGAGKEAKHVMEELGSEVLNRGWWRRVGHLAGDGRKESRRRVGARPRAATGDRGIVWNCSFASRRAAPRAGVAATWWPRSSSRHVHGSALLRRRWRAASSTESPAACPNIADLHIGAITGASTMRCPRPSARRARADAAPAVRSAAGAAAPASARLCSSDPAASSSTAAPTARRGWRARWARSAASSARRRSSSAVRACGARRRWPTSSRSRPSSKGSRACGETPVIDRLLRTGEIDAATAERLRAAAEQSSRVAAGRRRRAARRRSPSSRCRRRRR